MDSNVNVFLEATRQGLRFSTTQGLLSVEDLWDLPLTSQRGSSLDSLAISLSKQLRDQTESFVNLADASNEEITLKFNIVKQIIDIKLAERAAAKLAKDRAEKRQKILAILDRKEEAVLESSSADELRTMLATL